MSEQQSIEAYDQAYNVGIPIDWWELTWRPSKFAYGSGPYGSGYMVDGHNTTETQANNAYCIALYLMAQGWQLEAICGMLGNIQSEGMTQPGYWQSNDVGVMTTGFGIVQWTPATKYINWAEQTWGADDPWAPYYYSGWYECYRIACECVFNLSGQWIPTSDYNIPFRAFAQGQGLVGNDKWDRTEYAASAWLYNYERPSNPQGKEAQRRVRAHAWMQRFNDLFPNYQAITHLKQEPQIPGPYFGINDIGGRPIWWYKVWYMASRKGSAFSVFSK